jgi:acyl-homoserine-lactone acylase
MRLPLFLGMALAALSAHAADDLARWQQHARNVTITRDTWGIPHIHGKTDADAVFGFLYAQAEDDFPRIELNYLNSLGRLAEVEGEAELYRDLRMRLFISEAELRAQYAASPGWLRALMDAWADGLNYYLHTHPAAKPRLLTRFDPWMALSFTEGSIGGDIESIALKPLEQFYGGRRGVVHHAPRPAPFAGEPGGSNGFAIAPRNSANGHALLLINPHTTFYFRPEVHVASDEGLNAYGAVTWGQFFVYQGFNDRVGWMHTSGGADTIDEYAETVVRTGDRIAYRYGAEERPFRVTTLELPFKQGAALARRTFTTYHSHHGPVIREENGRWIAIRLMQNPIQALAQSWLRTKARNYAEFRRTMDLRTNSSNNTVYADADGTIAYFHGNFVPVRDPKFDWQKPVDGSDPATEWKGLHPVAETITLLNPPIGWIQNTNNWPFAAAGPDSPRREAYPRYTWAAPRYDAENPRGLNAVRVLSGRKGFTLDTLIAAAYDPYLIAFEQLLPPLFRAYDEAPAAHPLKSKLSAPVAALRAWDRRTSTGSVATSVASFWGQELLNRVTEPARAKGMTVYDYIVSETTPREKLEALDRAVTKLETSFGTWQTPWGEINRFQRLSGNVQGEFDDAQPSLAVGFASATWGSLAAYGATQQGGTKRIYGTRGNSFVAVVEFGPRVRAKSILAGGVSGDPASPHFNDQAERYARGEFKDVRFYPEDIAQHARRTYRPGE